MKWLRKFGFSRSRTYSEGIITIRILILILAEYTFCSANPSDTIIHLPEPDSGITLNESIDRIRSVRTFNNGAVAKVLGMNEDETPLYIMPIALADPERECVFA